MPQPCRFPNPSGRPIMADQTHSISEIRPEAVPTGGHPMRASKLTLLGMPAFVLAAWTTMVPVSQAQDVPALAAITDSAERARVQALIDGARKENALSWIGVQIEPGHADPMLAEFKRYYGLPDFKGEYTYAGTGEIVTRIEQLLQGAAQQFRHRVERLVGLVQGPAQARRDHEVRLAPLRRLHAVRQERHDGEGLLGLRRLRVRPGVQSRHAGRARRQGFQSDQLEGLRRSAAHRPGRHDRRAAIDVGSPGAGRHRQDDGRTTGSPRSARSSRRCTSRPRRDATGSARASSRWRCSTARRTPCRCRSAT